jgi:hypothetical protein
VKNDEHGRAVIEAVRNRELTYAMARAAIFYQRGRHGDIKIPVPGYIVEDILGHVSWPFDAVELS